MTKKLIYKGDYTHIYQIDLNTFKYTIEIYDSDGHKVSAQLFKEKEFEDILNWKNGK